MKKWIIITLCVLFLLGIGIVFAIIQSNNETKGTEMKEETELASNETNTTNTIETLARETKISPNAKIIKKEYYKKCDRRNFIPRYEYRSILEDKDGDVKKLS